MHVEITKWELKINSLLDMYTLLPLKWITNKDLLHSTWTSSMLCGSLDGRGVWGKMDTCMYMAESLCCSPPTIRTLFINWLCPNKGFPSCSVGKESACSAGDVGLIPGSGRSPGRGHGNLLQRSCLENPTGRAEHDWSDWAGIPQCEIKSKKTPPKNPKQINPFPILLTTANVPKIFYPGFCVTYQSLCPLEMGRTQPVWLYWGLRRLNGIISSMDVNLSTLREMVKDRGDWSAAFHGAAKSWTHGVPEQQQVSHWPRATDK